MKALISTNQFSTLALMALVRENEHINALAAHHEDDFDLMEIEDALAEEMNLALNTEDTVSTKALLEFFNTENEWVVHGYTDQEQFEKAQWSDQSLDYDHIHDVTSSSQLCPILSKNQIVKIRSCSGEESFIINKDDWIRKAMLKLNDLGITTEISLSNGKLRYLGANTVEMASLIEGMDNVDSDSETISLISQLTDSGIQHESIDGWLMFSEC